MKSAFGNGTLTLHRAPFTTSSFKPFASPSPYVPLFRLNHNLASLCRIRFSKFSLHFNSILWDSHGILALRRCVAADRSHLFSKRYFTIRSEFFSDILHNQALVSATAASLCAQLLKPFFSATRSDELNLKLVFKSGGMPSAHSAVVTALATAIWLERGAQDPLFALAVVYACIVMYDAQGVRRAVGKQAEVINTLLVPELITDIPPWLSQSSTLPISTPNSLASTTATEFQEAKQRAVASVVTPDDRDLSTRQYANDESSNVDHSPSSRSPSNMHANSEGEVHCESGDGMTEQRRAEYAHAVDKGGQNYEEGGTRSAQFWEKALKEPSVVKGEVEEEEIGDKEGWRHIPLKESVGHTKLEVVVGGVLGIVLSLCLGQLFFPHY